MTLAIVLFQAPIVRATDSTPVYVLGVTSPLDPLIINLQSLSSSVTILPGVSSLTLVGSGSILYVDTQWLQTAAALDPTILSLVVGKALGGVPTVAIRGNPSLLGDSISGLVRAGTPGLPLISQGIQIIGTLPDGTRQGYVLQVIAGFDYAVKAEFTWARQLLLQTASPTGPGPATGTASPSANHRLLKTTSTADSSGAPYFAFRLMHTTDTGDQFSPRGRVSYTFTLWALQNSGSSDYKWYNFFWNETVQPGIMVYNSDWRVIQETDHVSASNHTSSLFVDHGPQIFGTSGPSTLSYTIGTEAGVLNAAVTANQTQSYFLKNAEVTDITQDGFSLGWDHTFNARTSAGKLSYSITPGWTDRIRMDGHIDVQGSFSTTFARFSGSNVVQTSSVTTQLFVFGG